MLVAQAAGPDLQAEKLLFEILVKLQHADVFSGGERLPKVQLDDSIDAQAVVAADIERGVEEMRREMAARDLELRGQQRPAATRALV